MLEPVVAIVVAWAWLGESSAGPAVRCGCLPSSVSGSRRPPGEKAALSESDVPLWGMRPRKATLQTAAMLIKRKILVAFLALFALLGSAAGAGARGLTSPEASLLQTMNTVRTSQGLPPLRPGRPPPSRRPRPFGGHDAPSVLRPRGRRRPGSRPRRPRPGFGEDLAWGTGSPPSGSWTSGSQARGTAPSCSAPAFAASESASPSGRSPGTVMPRSSRPTSPAARKNPKLKRGGLCRRGLLALLGFHQRAQLRTASRRGARRARRDRDGRAVSARAGPARAG